MGVKFLLNYQLKNEVSQANFNNYKKIYNWQPFMKKFYSTLLRVRCLKVVGSLLSNQNTGMLENTTRIFIPHERSNSTTRFHTSSTRLVNTLDLRHLRPLPDTRNLSVTITTSVGTSQSLQAFTRPLSH